jgi:predicted HTH transcriptional regulator
LTPEEFEQLISQREGETLDFKQEMPSSSDLAKLVTAFYNTRGGTIVFGVENGTRRPVGVPNPQGIEGARGQGGGGAEGQRSRGDSESRGT